MEIDQAICLKSVMRRAARRMELHASNVKILFKECVMKKWVTILKSLIIDPILCPFACSSAKRFVIEGLFTFDA